jgi:hypothetical protein
MELKGSRPSIERLKAVEKLKAAFIEQLTEAMERQIEARARSIAAEWTRLLRAAPAASPRSTVRPGRPGPRKRADPAQSSPLGSPTEAPGDAPIMPASSEAPPAPRRRARQRVPARAGGAPREAPPPPPPDPEREARDAELARLRMLLKPTAPEDLPAVPPAAVHASMEPIDSPPDAMRALEDEVREQVNALAKMPSSSCTARIAAWVGRVRLYEETTGNRIAAQLLIDKLRALAHAMEAGHIEALRTSWRAPDWPAYIRKNEALAAAPPAAPTIDWPP